MVGTLLRRFLRRMQRKGEENEPSYAGQWRCGLRLRCHPAAERASSGEQRQVGCQSVGFSHRGAHGSVADGRGIGALTALLHIRKLITQRCDAELRELCSDRGHRWVMHSRASAVRKHETCLGMRRSHENARYASVLGDADGDRCRSHTEERMGIAYTL